MITGVAQTPPVQTPPIRLTPEEWAIVSEILRRHAAGRMVWAYGSRARGEGVEAYSDLDLIVSGQALGGLESWRLEEAFDESRLRFRVQFQYLDNLSAEFRQRVEKDFVVVQDAPERDVV